MISPIGGLVHGGDGAAGGRVRLSLTAGAARRSAAVVAAMLLLGAGPATAAAPGAPWEVSVEREMEVWNAADEWLWTLVKWRAPRDGSTISSWKVQWKTGAQEYDSARQRTIAVPNREAPDTVSGSSHEARMRPGVGRYDFEPDVEYAFRVLAVNGDGTGAPSPEVSATHSPAQHIAEHVESVVRRYEGAFPWVRSAMDYMRQHARFAHDPVKSEQSGEVITACSPLGPIVVPAYWCGFRDVESVLFGSYEPNDLITLHELAHVYEIAGMHRIAGFPNAAFALAEVYFDKHVAGPSVEGYFRVCSGREVMADGLAMLAMGDYPTTSHVAGIYWERCYEHDRNMTLEDEAALLSALAGEIPRWFHDTYRRSDGTPDLERLWEDVKSSRRTVFHLRDAFGGYCDPQALVDMTWYKRTSEEGIAPGVTNPWKDGGCFPGAPQELTIEGVGEEGLTLSWEAPSDTGGFRVEGYVVQWKTGDEEYSTERRAEVDTLAHAIAGLADEEAHAVRVAGVNYLGESSAWAEAARPAGGDTAAPVLESATVDRLALTLGYDETLDEDSVPASGAFTVTVGGAARAADSVAVSGGAVTLTLASAVGAGETVTVGYAVPTGAGAAPVQDASGNAAVAFTGRSVVNRTSSNTAPTGLPTVSGTLVAGETLTASASGIADADGLAGATFAWQWMANDGTGDAQIAGATAQTYTLTSAEVGKTVRVRVTWTDDGGTGETLVGDATAAVKAPLTARFEMAPASHDGSAEFTIRLRFSDYIVYAIGLVEDHLEIVNGTLTDVDRMIWAHPPGFAYADAMLSITVAPSGTDDVTVSLPASSTCETGTTHLCTLDDRPLSQGASVTIRGPGNPAVTTTSPILAPENALAIATLAAADADTTAADLVWSLAGGADQDKVALSAVGVLSFVAAQDFEAPDDADRDGDYRITVRVTDGASPMDAALTVRLTDVDEVAPALASAHVDGDALALTFNEALDGSSTPDATAFSVTVDGAARAVSDVAVGGTTVTLTLASAVEAAETVTVAYTAPTGANAGTVRDDGGNPAADFPDRPVANDTAAAANAAPTGLPVISGTARVGETLTGSASGIADADGLANATFAWQWVSNDGTTDADIAGATQATYALTAAQAGATAKVRVTYTDDAGTEETLVSAATAAVTTPLTASFGNVPASHDGSAPFTFELHFSEEIRIGYQTLRDTSLEVGGGTVMRAKRQTKGSNIAWTITVEPDTDGDVAVALPADRACGAAGAVCTAGGKRLSAGVVATVPGPASQLPVVAIAPGTDGGVRNGTPRSDTVTEGTAAVFALTRTGDSAVALTVNVSVTETGAMLAAPPPAAVVFNPGSATAELTVGTHDDEVDEAASDVSVSVATGVGYVPDTASAAAMVTVEDDDAAPAVTTASPVLAPENGVAIAVLAATDADTAVADLAWSVVGGADADEVASSGDGVLTFKAAKDFEAPDDADADGDYEVVVRVTDGANPVDAALTVRLTDADEIAPPPTVAPVISTPAFMVVENTTAVATLAATDADTAPADLAWSIDGGVDAAHFALTGGGVLTFAAAKNFEVPDDDGGDGTYDVIVAVTDGADRATAALAVTLVNVNEAPVADAGPDRSGVREGTQVTLDGSASSDPDAGDAPTWLWTQTDSSGHAVTLSDPAVPGPSFEAPSDLDADTMLEFKLQVTDAAGLRSEDRVTVTVTARPTIAIRPAAAYAKEGEDAVYKLTRTGSADVTLTVLVGVSENGAMLGTLLPSSVFFPSGARETELRIPTAGDGADEADSVVMVGIEDPEDPAGYRVSSSAGAASVTVLDDDMALFAEPAGGETLWTSTLTPEDIGGALLGYLGSGNALSPNGWSEDGVQFRVEQLTYFAQYSELAFQVSSAPSQAGQLRLHLDDLELEPDNVHGGRYFYWTVDHPGWQAGQAVAVRLVRGAGSGVSTDASLRSLSVSGATLGPAFDPDSVVYAARVASDMAITTVTADAAGHGAGIAVTPVDADAATPGRQVALGYGETLVTVAVTAQDGTTKREYRVVVTRPRPVASVSFEQAGYTATEGGAPAGVTVRLSAEPNRETVIALTATPAGGAGADDYEVAPSVTFVPGGPLAQTVTVTAVDDGVDDDGESVVLGLGAMPGSWVEAGSPAGTTVALADDDHAPAIVTGTPLTVREGVTPVATLTATDTDTPASGLAWTLVGGADAAHFDLGGTGVLSFRAAKDFEAPDDADRDGDYEIAVRVTDGANAVEAALTVRLEDVDEIAPALSGAEVDGASLTLTFSEALDRSAAPAAAAFVVTVGGTERGVSDVSAGAGTVTLTLAVAVEVGETVTVGYTVPAGATASPIRDPAGNPAAGFSGEAVTNRTAVHVNTAPTGLPTIAGTVRVGETLTASGSDIADVDGLGDTTFAWQWLANDGTADAEIPGATGSSYTLTAADAGKTIKVRVTFTDDEGTEETLVSDTTAAVAAVAAGLTADFVNVPARHDGSAQFAVDVAFSEGVSIGNAALRDHGAEATGGTVTRARRVDRRDDLRRLTIQPSGSGPVTVVLPADRACTVAGALCTQDGARLASRAQVTVAGPLAVISIAAGTSPVAEGTAASFTLSRTGDTTAALTVALDVTEDGAVLASVAPTEATFGAGSSTAELGIATEDDEVAGDGSTVTVAVQAGAGYTVAASATEASVTVEDDDHAPAITDTGPFTVDENETAVVTLTATDDDTPVADLVWSLAGGADAAAFELSAAGVLAFKAAQDFEAPGDTGGNGDYEVAVQVSDGANDTQAELTVRLADVDEVAPTLASASVDGETLTLTWDEALDETSAPGTEAFTVTVGGAARTVDALEVKGRAVVLSLATAVEPGEAVTVGYAVPTGAGAKPVRDAARNAAAGFSGEAVTNATTSNTPATGKPVVSGTAQMGETLTASASGVADADGLANAVFAWQWIANDGTSDADIAGATGATCTLTAAEEGKTVKVRVSFTDDGATEEVLVSEATAAVASALPVVSIAAVSTTTTEGRAARLTLTRTGAVASTLEVSVSVTQAGAVLSGTPASTVTFAAGNAEAQLRLATDDDDVAETDGRLTVSVVAGSGYGVDANASTATVDVYDNDEAVSTASETLWTSTLTVESIGGALLGTVGGGNALSPDGWSEDGEAFEAEQLYYFPQYSELAFTLSVAPSETGQLTLHLDDLQMPLRGSPGVRYFYWVVDHPGWQAGQAVAVKLTRTDPDAVVAAVPGVSVADAQVQEGEGAALSFSVGLAESQDSTVSVRYATSDGTATAGADYVAQSGALRFAPGETSKTVSVSVLNDAHDEGSETMTLTLSRPFGAELADATATGTIVNTDPVPKAWLARFGRTVAEHVIEAVDDRLTAPLDTGSQVTIAGRRVDLEGGGQSWDGGWEQGRRDGAPLHPGRDRAGRSDPLLDDRFFSDGLASGASRDLSAREFLSGTAFRFASQGGDDAGQWTMWGRGAWSSFDARDEALSLDGDVTTGMVGTDYRRDGWLAGLVFSHSEGSGTYALDGATEDRTRGELDTSLTGLYPYLGTELSERLTAWGVAGYGQGTLTLRDGDAAALETDIDFTMAAGGMRGEVLGGGERGGFGLAVESDALIARTGSEGIAGLLGTAATVSRLRVGLEGSYALALDGGGTLAPTLEMGLRHDGGDAETGFGVELGGGLRHADPVRGISTDFNVRGLVAHEDSGYGEWGASGSLRYDPTGASDLGPSLTLTQHWGVSSSGGMESLFARQTMSGIAPEDDRYAPGARLDAEIGYGFSVPGGRSVAIPHVGMSRAADGRTLRFGSRLRLHSASQWHLEGEIPHEGGSTWRLGYRYGIGRSTDLGVEGVRHEKATDDSIEHGIWLSSVLRW